MDSNDALYAQDEEFLKEIATYCEIVFQELLDNFKKDKSDVIYLLNMKDFLKIFFRFL